MTSKFNLPVKENKMTETKRTFKPAPGKKVKFMGEQIEIFKLSVSQVMEVQRVAKEQSSNAQEDNGLQMLEFVIKLGAPELKDFTTEELYDFPLDELSMLSSSIMEFSGLNKTGKSS